MSMWSDLQLEDRVVDVLADVPTINDVHHFGRPYVTAYQLAIRFERMFPAEFQAIGKPLGGRGTGQHNSLTQYLAGELSRQIKRHGKDYRIEGAFVSNRDARDFVFTDLRGEAVHSSLVETDYDLSLFRLRRPLDDA